AFFMNTETQERRIDVPIVITAKKDMADLQKIKEDLAEWLYTEQPTELIFDDELDRTYLALIDGSIDLEELVNRGKGVITFICPMPYKLGPAKTVEFQANERGLAANVQNKGSVESNPIIEVEVKNPSTFLDVWNGNNYFRIGWPLRM
ncbi:distal tail protein Dit, partial [Bacillus cereus]|uniref:distal tail protein Dit n=1 Tax=Bacillus cereus TaxID=1396 RepID=UPI001155B470